MSIPPLLSRSPPPICETSDEDDDAFGNYVGSSDLAVDISQGADILEEYEKKAINTRYEDTTSEDSGLCMSSVGQNQSPCETSPVSSTYIQTVGLEIDHNCDKADLNLSTSDPKSYEQNFQDKSVPESKKLNEYIEISGVKVNSEVKFETIRNLEQMKTHLLCGASTLSSDSENGCNTKCGEEFEMNNDVCYDRNLEVSEDKNIPQTEYGIDICDQDNFIAKVDRFIEAENIDFDDFQVFEVDDEHKDSLNEADKILNESFASLEVDIAVKCPQNINKQNQIKNGIIGDYNNLICDVISSDQNSIDLNDTEGKAVSSLCQEAEVSEPNIFSFGGSLDINETHSSTKQLTPTTSESCENVCKPIDNSDEDDFSDFADFQSNVDVIEIDKNSSIPVQTSLQESWTHWSNWWPECSNPDLITVQLSNELEGSKIWQELKESDNSPALMYQWSSSMSNCKLLSALNIDSRNILLGPWNRYKFSATESFPSNIMKKPISGEKTEFIDEATIFKDPVPDAHFDWVGSGLVNPLDSPRIGRVLCESDDTKKVPHPSKLAEEILQNLPDLSFMRKSFIVFPKCVT